MRTIPTLVVFAFLVAVCAGCGRKEAAPGPNASTEAPASDQAAAEAKAVAAAEVWLALVDSGNYAKSWEDAASFFRKLITQADWAKTAEAFRPALGKLVSRKVGSKQYATSLPGAPDGHYVVIQFETVFENKQSAVETVTPMLDTDGQWRVSGYFIK